MSSSVTTAIVARTWSATLEWCVAGGVGRPAALTRLAHLQTLSDALISATLDLATIVRKALA